MSLLLWFRKWRADRRLKRYIEGRKFAYESIAAGMPNETLRNYVDTTRDFTGKIDDFDQGILDVMYNVHD